MSFKRERRVARSREVGAVGRDLMERIAGKDMSLIDLARSEIVGKSVSKNRTSSRLGIKSKINRNDLFGGRPQTVQLKSISFPSRFFLTESFFFSFLLKLRD